MTLASLSSQSGGGGGGGGGFGISGWSLSELDVLLLAGTLGHTLSLAASSFVEEEHQTWYFLLNTLCLAVFQDVCRKYFREQRRPGAIGEGRDHGDEEEEEEEEEEERFFLSPKGRRPSDPSQPGADPRSREKWLALATPPLTLACCRMLRTLNQTGVQWAHLPDMGHWLNRCVFRRGVAVREQTPGETP